MKLSDFYVRAMEMLIPEAGWRVTNDIINLSECPTNVTETQIVEKAIEMLAAQPLKELREERNRRIALTDWRFRSDLSPSQEWKDYCVALRDLPANYSPTIDIIMEDGYPLVKEDNTTPWPKEPTDG